MIISAAAAAAAVLALQGAPLAVADATTAPTPVPVATGDVCSSGGNVIGLTLDSSGSISSVEFEAARTQVTNFVDSTSGLPNVNDNLYYLSFFESVAYGGTGPLQTNEGRRVSNAFEAVPKSSGGTDIIAGMQDIEEAFRDAGVSAGVAIVVTDGGCCTDETLKAAGDGLRALGATVVAVGIDAADINSLNAFASVGPDGSPIVFTGDQFDQIESLLVGALQDIDSDGDGVSDCVDGCPSDATKTEPGVCGCGVPEGTCSGMPPTSDRGIDLPEGGSARPPISVAMPPISVPAIPSRPTPTVSSVPPPPSPPPLPPPPPPAPAPPAPTPPTTPPPTPPPDTFGGYGGYGCEDDPSAEGCDDEVPGRERRMRRPRDEDRRPRGERGERPVDPPRVRDNSRDRRPRRDRGEDPPRERRPRDADDGGYGGYGGYGDDGEGPTVPPATPPADPPIPPQTPEAPIPPGTPPDPPADPVIPPQAPEAPPVPTDATPAETPDTPDGNGAPDAMESGDNTTPAVTPP